MYGTHNYDANPPKKPVRDRNAKVHKSMAPAKP